MNDIFFPLDSLSHKYPCYTSVSTTNKPILSALSTMVSYTPSSSSPYHCLFVDDKVFSLHTACEEILRNCFTTENGFDDDDFYNNDHNYDDDYDSIVSTETKKTKNSTPPKLQKKQKKRRSFDNNDDDSLVFKADNLAELQYLTNQSAQRIQREFEKQSDKCAYSYQRHLHERYGNKASFVDVNREHALAF